MGLGIAPWCMVMVRFPTRIAGGLLTRRKSRAGRWWYLWAGVCRSRVTQPEAYGVFGLPLLLPLRRSFISRFSSVSLRYGKRPLHWMMGGGACRWIWPQQQGISLFILLGRKPPPVAAFFRWIEYPPVSTGVHPLTALRLLGGVVLPRGIAGGGISPRTPCLWPTVP